MKLNKYRVYGHQNVNIYFDYELMAVSAEAAGEIAEQQFHALYGTGDMDVNDSEINCDMIKEH